MEELQLIEDPKPETAETVSESHRDRLIKLVTVAIVGYVAREAAEKLVETVLEKRRQAKIEKTQ